MIYFPSKKNFFCQKIIFLQNLFSNQITLYLQTIETDIVENKMRVHRIGRMPFIANQFKHHWL